MALTLAALGTLGLGALGLWWLLAPSSALDQAGHAAGNLPRVMGGRYLAMAALWGLAFLWGHGRDVALIYAALGLLDAFIYRATSPRPHLIAAGAALGAAALAHWA